MRYFIELSYNGTNYHGWQKQPNAKSVQEELVNSLSTLLGAEIDLVGAGRTDTGVHASKMVAHFDSAKLINSDSLISRMNSFLPLDIFIKRIYQVSTDLHARFSATTRTYKYYISRNKNPFNSNCYTYYRELDVDRMNHATSYLKGKQDFTSFSKLHTQTFTNNCNIIFANWSLDNDMLVFTITADRFLRNMVRSIVGTLLQVGEGKIDAESIKKIIAKKDRCKAGFSVPAHALFLTEITYS